MASDNPTVLFVDFVGREEIAARFNVHPRTNDRLSAQPDGLPYTKVGSQRFFHVPTVNDWMMNRMVNPNPRRGR